MIKIGIYSNDSAQRKDIKKLMLKYFDDFNVEAEISYIRTKSKVLKSITDKFTEFNIMIVCDEDKIIYFKRNGIISAKDYGIQTIGWLDSSIDHEKIDKILLNENNHNCPHGLYLLNTKKVIRAISYEEIEFFQRLNNKTIIYLTDGEDEYINESLKSIKDKLSEDFFADCVKSHIVNFYNVKKIDRVNHVFIMKSGREIPICKKRFTQVIRLYIKVIFEI